ncbi:HTH tetR-type domain-containing protein [Ruminococcaceae bacterium BL-6]|jgi:Transcriptional regulator|nr:HTH tetR-type domain-containing protein [Ruminococcaceae bacterium BL-6]
MKDHYHHGNLKNELIETSIRIISEEGFDRLSLRNISTLCGVSHNAIYRHFDNKEQLIEACRNFVTESMVVHLTEALGDADYASAETLRKLSFAYVSFYQQHPTYYSFLYRNSSIKIIFSLEPIEANYPPLELFRKAYRAYGEQNKLTSEECLTHLTRLWSLLHGLVALVISPNVEWDENWQKCLNDMI